ncbi:MAG: Tim44-like domain-containing protein [Betaproteobacteria bacterium]
MKIWPALMAVVFTLTLAFAGGEAQAKRLGGGKSTGKQSSNVTQREAAPPAAQPAPPSAPAAAPAAAAPKKPWGAMLGGLAAGLGLAWLAHSLGMGEGLAQFMSFALIALAVVLVVGFVLRKMRASRQPQGDAAPFAWQGAGAATAPAQYSPSNVGNDASARPWERPGTAFDSSAAAGSSGSMIGSALTGPQSSWGVLADFDVAGFLAAAKTNFVSLQAAWDRSDIAALRVMMTDDMLTQIQAQLADRESHTGGAANHTEVLTLDAKLLGIEELEDVYMASVEFSGMIREDQSAGPSPFREVWNMTKPRHNPGGWLVAGVQALQ